MEAATLSSPQRRFTVVPVQKSLSLPSYARAGGEGIDHKLIFAALELKEKSRRKSRIFAKEKTARQNLFCLPIPSSAKCRETSLSSDTSCSSLEYQKPKQVSKLKAEEVIVSAPRPSQTSSPSNDLQFSKTKPTRNESEPNSDSVRDGISPKCEEKESGHSLKVNDHHKNRRSPVEYLRPNVGSSDSMERSSRSSTDSLSRKERLTAIKARVEAAREKFGDSSSEEESRAVIARYNSDGVIHRTVRDVKSRSSRMDKRIRRRSQDEWAMRRSNRKNLSLCLTSHDDELLQKSLVTNGFNNNFECKTDFCPSPNYPDLSRKNYYSDFPNKENVARVVQARIKQIEEEERKRKNDLDLRDKSKIILRQNLENSICGLSEQRREISPDKNANYPVNFSKSPINSDVIRCTSPIPRSQQAPTPPPRSPKSITFINKAFIQHQNANRDNFENNSLERKGFFQSNIPNTRVHAKSDVNLPETKYTDQTHADSLERRRIRELLNSRRKTCGFFDFSDKVMLNKTNAFIDNTQYLFRECNKVSSPITSLTANDNERYDSQFLFSENMQKKLLKNKFSENEQKHEYMFNSLESKKKPNSPPWLKSENSPLKKQSCFCHVKPGDNPVCNCNWLKNKDSCKPFSSSIFFGKQANSLNLNHGEKTKTELKNPISRLSKSEINISFTESSKQDFDRESGGNACILPLQKSQTCPSPQDVPKMADMNDKISATANLESAMEELESVYRSLKFSSDNLSERNSMSQSEDDARLSKNESCQSEIGSKPRSSVKESIFKFDSLSKSGNDTKTSCNLNYPKHFNSNKHDSSNSDLHTSSTNLSATSTSVPKPFSIDELFNDLTRQLDIEQKQLKESRDNHCPSQFSSNVEKTENSQHLSPLESIVSLRKELYNNLQKSSLERLKNNESVRTDVGRVEDSKAVLARKKYKAIRSLSANISYLMTGENSDSSSSARNKSNVTDNSSNHNLQSSLKRESAHKYCPPINSTKNDYLYLKSPRPYKVPEKRTETDNFLNQKSDEIRHIRVSMDSNPIISNNTSGDSQEYVRLSSAVCGPQSPSKCDLVKRSEMNSPIAEPTPKDKTGVLDETGLEKLLNSLLTEVPESTHSSLLFPKDAGPATPPITSGKIDYVKHKRIFLPLKMETYVATKATGNHSSQECSQKSLTPEDSARKVKNDFCQNNAQLNPVSFIPVHTKQLMCHKFSSNKRDFETKSEEHPYATNVSSTNVVTWKCNADQKEKSSWLAKAHIRRRSVGFEDMTSVASNYGQNFSNERRFQAVMPNSNVPVEANSLSRNILDLESENNFEKQNESKNSMSTVNQNMQNSSENENDVCLRNETVRQKDKSSKRKSSLNRIDFIHSPAPNIENAYYRQNSVKQKNSSSDEGSEGTQVLQSLEFSNSKSKRKHNSSNVNISVLNLPGRKAKEVLQHGLSKVRTNLLPRALQNHSKARQPRWKLNATAHSSQKLSHSAGELETVSDFPDKCSSNSICLSAQEFDVQGYSEINSMNKNLPVKRHSAQSPKNNSLDSNATGVVGDNCSQFDPLTNDAFNSATCYSVENDQRNGILFSNCKSSINCMNNDAKTIDKSNKNHEALLKISNDQEVNVPCPKTNNSDINCGTVESSDCQDVHDNTIKLGNLEISPENGDDNEVYVSADESNDLVGSDGERRPNSILRKKFSEERKELHSILKPPPEDKFSKAPPSILKHRESSEEKEPWPQSDLHSILKKSTSEDESCNSGPDIRPILKVSTDEESPGGSVRPRPILKKRTSFSDECCYASFPSGELKPILKKKTPLNSEDQPRPILKSRRKSEDTRSTLTEFIASRPRAYSADMGVKTNHDTRSEGAELKNDFYQQNCHDL